MVDRCIAHLPIRRLASNDALIRFRGRACSSLMGIGLAVEFDLAPNQCPTVTMKLASRITRTGHSTKLHHRVVFRPKISPDGVHSLAIGTRPKRLHMRADLACSTYSFNAGSYRRLALTSNSAAVRCSQTEYYLPSDLLCARSQEPTHHIYIIFSSWSRV